MSKRTSGFTMLEVMVTVAILLFAAAFVAWGFGAQRPRQRLLGTATELHALVHSARQNALATGRRTLVLVFPEQATSSGKGRVFVVEDSLAGDFFNGSFAAFDPSKTVNLVGGTGADGGVLDSMDLPTGVSFGPASGYGGKTPAPYDIPLDAACTFCLGAESRGAIAFDSTGRATFWSTDGRSPLGEEDFENGASLSLVAEDVTEMRTLVVTAATGGLRTVAKELP